MILFFKLLLYLYRPLNNDFTYFVNECYDLVININKIYYFINSLTKTESVIFPTLPNSILYSNFYSSLKYAIIKPILKKPGLDIECLSNYRPISHGILQLIEFAFYK